MTDLVTLIKTAIENVPQRDGNGRIDVQAMAEAAAKVAVEEAARVVEHLNGWGTDCGRLGHSEHFVRCIRALIPKPSE